MNDVKEPPEPRRALILNALALALLLAAGSVLFFHSLGGSSLMGDETIHAIVAQQMHLSGDRWPPMFSTNLYMAKPPLKLWATSYLFDAGGVSPFSARLPDAHFGLGTLAVLFVIARRWVGPWLAALAGLLMATSTGYLTIHGARFATQDSALIFFMTSALGLYIANRAGTAPAASPRRTGIPCGILLALALWCKGWVALLALLAPFLFELVRCLYHRPARPDLRAVLWMAGVALALFLPWPIAMFCISDGDYLTHLHKDVWLRYRIGIDPLHTANPRLYSTVLLDNFHLWLLTGIFPVIAFVRAWKKRNTAQLDALFFFLVWLVSIYAALSSSVSKLPWYLYPAFPALALLLVLGTGFVLADLHASRPARIAIPLLIGSLAAHSFVRAYRVVDTPPHVIDADLFARACAADPQAYVQADHDLRRREWVSFHLTPLIRRKLTPEDSIPEPRGYLLTNHPERYAGSAADIRKIRPESPDEHIVYVISFNGPVPGLPPSENGNPH